MQYIKKLNEHCVFDGDSLSKAMEQLRLLSPDKKFLVVLDKDSKLVGTLTDGDIRRGMMNGFSVENPVSFFAYNNPHVGSVHESNTILRKKLNRAKSNIPFLPIMATDQSIKSIIFTKQKIKKDIAALVMAGGFGRRLKEQTINRPKALVEVGGVPIIEHIFRKLESADIQHFYVAVHHMSDQIIDYLKVTRRFEKVSFLFEEKPLGTAGAIGLIPKTLKSNLLVTNCDVLTSLDFRSFCNFNVQSPNLATIAVVQHQVMVPFGVVKHNLNGDFLGVEEKPVIANSVAAGIYFFKPMITRFVRRNSHINMPELINNVHVGGHRVGVFPVHEYWSDIGSRDDLIKANEIFEAEFGKTVDV